MWIICSVVATCGISFAAPSEDDEAWCLCAIDHLANVFAPHLNAPLQDITMEAAAVLGLYVVEVSLFLRIASEWSSLGSRSGGCEACRLIPFHGVEAASLLGLLIDVYGRVCSVSPADEMNFDNCCWSKNESRF
ncbi:hypothetical protein Nepgr_007811 [Nepenthes gracilis]|uniref:Secreted protein n=1 Tax=Nepenthes gracilis TaxID=150966 RepID=A0AAD3XIV6_NEPGR|nr:hypothetical protein Nepgr_007811 [Nepenthes gracilis]